MAQRPEATLVNSYERWTQLGRQVRKGEHGIKIFYPKHRVIEAEDEGTGEKRKRLMLTGFGIGNVFDVSQTEGDPLPEPPRSPKSLRSRHRLGRGEPPAVPPPHR